MNWIHDMQPLQCSSCGRDVWILTDLPLVAVVCQACTDGGAIKGAAKECSQPSPSLESSSSPLESLGSPDVGKASSPEACCSPSSGGVPYAGDEVI